MENTKENKRRKQARWGRNLVITANRIGKSEGGSSISIELKHVTKDKHNWKMKSENKIAMIKNYEI